VMRSPSAAPCPISRPAGRVLPPTGSLAGMALTKRGAPATVQPRRRVQGGELANVKIFISYSREDRVTADQVRDSLNELGHETWIDEKLTGGQPWWNQILDQIQSCDAFLPIVSDSFIESKACESEFDWALAVRRHIIPLLVGRISAATPAKISTLQGIEYKPSDITSALKLAKALTAVQPGVPLPSSMPTRPEMPLSYLEGLARIARSPEDLSRDEQTRILREVEPGLAARDEAERAGAWQVLDLLERRQSKDLYSSSKDRIVALRDKYSNSSGTPTYSPPTPPPAVPTAVQPVAQPSEPTTAGASRSAEQHPAAEPPAARGGWGCGKYVIGAVVAVATIFFLLLLAASCSDTGYYY
jgi:hypothetical protein